MYERVRRAWATLLDVDELRTLMADRGLPVPALDRNILSICVTALCQGSQAW